MSCQHKAHIFDWNTGSKLGHLSPYSIEEGQFRQTQIVESADLAEQRVTLTVGEKVQIGKHEGIFALSTLRTAETPSFYFLWRNRLVRNEPHLYFFLDDTFTIQLSCAPTSLPFLACQLSFPTGEFDWLHLSEFYWYFYRSVRNFSQIIYIPQRVHRPLKLF